ncbi:hypothetical protein MPER_00648, partial [Moniliophthora perniciosa FA553]
MFHECDIMEDVTIAYGFNNVPHTFPATTTVGQPSAIMKLSDINDGNSVVKIANPKTLELTGRAHDADSWPTENRTRESLTCTSYQDLRDRRRGLQRLET